ncbi:hypothetical protein JR053_02890 [Wolbachia endosymbiont of Nasonia vitripennis]|uniref:hypothetical protein n=1 Tax=Wolbachia endosymbiont of Nasonia vitripennis TaxID=180837 RepID=UPI003A86B432
MQTDQNLRNNMPDFKLEDKTQELAQLQTFKLKSGKENFSKKQLEGPVRGLHVEKIIDDLKEAINTNIINNLNTIIKDEYKQIKALNKTVGNENSGLVKSLNDLRTDLTLPPASPSLDITGEENGLL